MGPQHILVVETGETLLGAAVESLLRHAPDLNVSMCHAADKASLIDVIGQVTADVVVVHATAQTFSQEDALALLGTSTSLRIVLINDYDNVMHVYDKNQVTIEQVDDLFSIIRRSRCA
jgi:hypothetical protein